MPGFKRFGRALLTVRAPLAGEPIAFELLDSMSRDLVQDERAKRTIERFQDLPIAVSAFLVQVGMIAEVDHGQMPGT